MKEKITIFTPTYNRKKFIERIYNSLLKQTSYDFIWLIVDDGSNDGTDKYVLKVKDDAKFKIEYIYKENGGKHTAHNTAVLNCCTKYLLILDSDDLLSNDCIAVLCNYIKKIKNNEKVCGIIGNRFVINSHEPIGCKIPNVEFASGLELYQRMGFYGDTLRLYKTEILKKYLFPVIEGEKFIPENVVFDLIDLDYKFLVIKDELYYGEYQEDGYTSNIYAVHNKNPKGYTMSLKIAAETAITLKKKINYIILYLIWCIKKKEKHYLKDFKFFYLGILLFPIAKIFILLKFPKFFFKNFND